MHQSRLVVTAALLFAAIMLPGCAGSVSPALTPAARLALDTTPVKVRFGYVSGIAFPTLIVADGRGYLAQENITIEKTALGGSGLVTEALASGNLDIGQTAPSSSLLATVKGAKTVMVSGFEYSFVDKTGKSWEASFLVVRHGEGIQKLSDLKGKKVAVPSLGGASAFMLRAKMLANGINPDKDMTIVPVAIELIPGALMQKLVDAAHMSTDAYMQVQKLGPVDVIATQTSLEDLDMDLTSVIGVNTDFSRKSPDTVVRFLRALLQARLWMAEDVARNDGKSMLELIGQSMHYSPEQAETLYRSRAGYYGKELESVNLLDIPTRVIQRQVEILKVNGAIKQDTPAEYSQVVDLQFLGRAYESLGLQWDAGKH